MGHIPSWKNLCRNLKEKGGTVSLENYSETGMHECKETTGEVLLTQMLKKLHKYASW